MASWEMKLIAQILEKKNVEIPLKRGITPDLLKHNTTAKTIFNFIIEHRTKQGITPSPEMVAAKFIGYDHIIPDDPLESICDIVLDLNITKELNNELEEVQALIDSSPRAALEQLYKASSRLSRLTIRSDDISIKDYLTGYKEEYKRIKEVGGITGYKFPWATLNNHTGGLCPQNLIVIYGSAKSCKSWLLIYIGIELFLREGRKVMIVTKEMSPLEVARRCVALIAKTDYDDLMRAKLSPEKEHLLFGDITKIVCEATHGDILITDSRADSGELSVASIQSKAEIFNPDVLMVDGAYLLSDNILAAKSKEYEKVTQINRGLKDLAQRMKIPVLLTSQANRYGDRRSRTGSIGFSVSYIQDCDMLMSILRDAKSEEIAIKLDAVREGKECGFVINAKVASDFSEKSSSISEMDRFLQADSQGIHHNYGENKQVEANIPKIEIQGKNQALKTIVDVRKKINLSLNKPAFSD